MAYLGNTPGVSSQRLVSSFTATAGQTSFTPSGGYMLGYVDVLVNGVELLDGADFTAADGVNVVLTAACAAGDEVKIKAWLPRGLSDGYTKSEADARYEPIDSAYTKAESDAKYPTKANNLSDLASASTARTNLGLGTLATVSPTGTANTTTFLRGDNSWQVVAVTPTAVSDQLNASTGYFDLPTGTTAQRPGTPVFGMVRANTTIGEPEWYDANGARWVPFADRFYDVEYLVIAGGGGGGGGASGGNQNSGGGGAGGYRSSVVGQQSGGNSSAEARITVAGGQNITVVVGAGAGVAGSTQVGFQGSNSSFGSIVSLGGGGGGNHDGGNPTSGGSGGGGARTGNLTGGAGTSGQGFAGGNSGADAGQTGAGGGGAGQIGQNGNGLGGNSNGGAGLQSNITGTSVFRAGGGGGSRSSQVVSGGHLGGSGGGGNGATGSNQGGDGVANSGSGGGGSYGAGVQGSAGGSGIVIIRYLGAQKGTGGTVTSSGGYTIHTFTTSGTYTA